MDTGATAAYLRLQSPAERRQVICTYEVVEAVAEVYRADMQFPADWFNEDDWDCAVSPEPVHVDYWRTLTEVQHELRLARARVAEVEERLRIQIEICKELSVLAGEPQ